MSLAPTPHLVIGGSLDGQWIDDDIRAPAGSVVAYAAKVAPGNTEAWRVVEFRLGRVISRHVWILRGMTEAQAFDRLLLAYRSELYPTVPYRGKP